MESDRIFSPRVFSFEDLDRFTNGFSGKNLIGETMFGKVYHGKISHDDQNVGSEAQEVTVKTWVDREIYRVNPEDKIVRAREEIDILQQQNLTSHPNLVKLIGYCIEGEQVGVVYDLKSLDTVHNLIFEESFTWMRRIRVAVELAGLIDFLHNEKHHSVGYLVRNIGPPHIMLDRYIVQEFCPKLFDFGMLSGGLLPDKREIRGESQFGCYGYSDLWYATPGGWRDECDVYSFGCVLIALMCKRVFNEKRELCFEEDFPFNDLCGWAREAYFPKYDPLEGIVPSECSLVHESLILDEGFHSSDGIEITRLMLRCVERDPSFRPTMKEVFQSLLKLRVGQQVANELGLKDAWKTSYSEYAT